MKSAISRVVCRKVTAAAAAPEEEEDEEEGDGHDERSEGSRGG